MKEFYDLKLHGTRNRQRYLDNTDWEIIRNQETGILVDQDILDKRHLARSEISLIRDALNYSDIQHLTQEF